MCVRKQPINYNAQLTENDIYILERGLCFYRKKGFDALTTKRIEKLMMKLKSIQN